MADPQDNTIPPPPAGFTPVQSAGVPPPPPGFVPVGSTENVQPPEKPAFQGVTRDSGNQYRATDEESTPEGAAAAQARRAKALPAVAAAGRYSENALRTMGAGMFGDSNEEVKQRLKEIALHPLDTTLSFGKGIADAQTELAHKAKEAWKNGDHIGAAAYALYYLLPGIGPSLAKSAEQMAGGDVAGGLGTATGAAAPLVMDAVKPEPVVPKTGFKAASEASAREAAARPKVVAKSAQDLSPQAVTLKEAGERAIAATDESGPHHTTYPRTPEETQQAIKESQGPDAKSLKEAGQNVQEEAQGIKKAKGKELGAAKETLKKSLPENVKTDDEYQKQALTELGNKPSVGFARNQFADKEFGDLDTEQQAKVLDRAKQIKSTETGQMPFPSSGEAVKTAKALAKDLGEEKLGLKDPNSPLGKLVGRLTSGKNPDGGSLSFSFDDAEASRQALSNAIKSEYSKMTSGGDGTLYHRLVGLKQSFDEDLYDTWEKYGDAAQAQKVRQLGRQYANIIADQYRGPAKALFRTQKPEQIVSSMVSGGAKSESTLDSLMNNSTPKGAATLRDSVQQEIYRQSLNQDGTVNATKALTKLNRMGNTGQKLFGSKYQELQTMLADAAKKQAAGEETPSIFSKAQLENPEKVVHDIVSQGATQQSFAENIMKRLPEAEKKTFADSVDAEIRRQTMAEDGNIDGVKARKKFYSMSDTAKAVFGDSYQERKQFYDALSKATEAKNKPSLASRIVPRVARAGGVAAGGTVAGVPGAVATGELAGDAADFLVGKSGAVKIGISPTERIVLSPAEAAAKRPMITKFLKAKSAGNVSAMTAAYNALAQPVQKTDK